MEGLPQKPKQPQKPQEETFDSKRHESIEQGNGEIGKSESRPKTRTEIERKLAEQMASHPQTINSPPLTELEKKLAALKAGSPQNPAPLKQTIPQPAKANPNASPPSAST